MPGTELSDEAQQQQPKQSVESPQKNHTHIYIHKPCSVVGTFYFLSKAQLSFCRRSQDDTSPRHPLGSAANRQSITMSSQYGLCLLGTFGGARSRVILLKIISSEYGNTSVLKVERPDWWIIWGNKSITRYFSAWSFEHCKSVSRLGYFGDLKWLAMSPVKCGEYRGRLFTVQVTSNDPVQIKACRSQYAAHKQSALIAAEESLTPIFSDLWTWKWKEEKWRQLWTENKTFCSLKTLKALACCWFCLGLWPVIRTLTCASWKQQPFSFPLIAHQANLITTHQANSLCQSGVTIIESGEHFESPVHVCSPQVLKWFRRRGGPCVPLAGQLYLMCLSLHAIRYRWTGRRWISLRQCLQDK